MTESKTETSLSTPAVTQQENDEDEAKAATKRQELEQAQAAE